MTSTRRLLPLALATVIAASTAAIALAHSGGGEAAPMAGHHHARAAHDHGHAAVSANELALRRTMDRLWEEHVAWTRLAIISLTTNAPDTKATVARLLQNQTDIGNAVKPFYGAAAGNELTRQLRAHIMIAAEVVLAAKAGDHAKLADAQARWNANADQIATVLNSVNPRYWPLATMKAEMHMHLKLTTDEAVARLQGNWKADVAAYDKVHRHILHMSDMLSDGIVKQFPSRFR